MTTQQDRQATDPEGPEPPEVAVACAGEAGALNPQPADLLYGTP